MVDLTPFKEKLKIATKNTGDENPRCLFLDALFLSGFKPPKVLRDGVIDRIADPTDKGKSKSGWYIYNQYEDIAIGVYGSWKGYPERIVWTSRSEHSLSFQQRIKLNEEIKEAEAKRKIEEERLRNEAAENAFKLWDKAKDATQENAYIKKKKVKVYDGVREDGDTLLIPVCIDGHLTSLQKIKPDSTKRFLTGGRTKGCYFRIDGDERKIYIAEGYATAASIAEATGNCCYVSFSAHNLYEVAESLKEKKQESKIIIAADNDDTCRNKAQQIQDALGIEPIYPKEPHNDFNDWHVAEGIEALTACLTKEAKKYKKQEKKNHANDFIPTGVLSKIINYYNATSGNDQPLFAVQCAIATCSVILGRSFQTNFSNRSSLFLLNIAKSGTGKEHAKKVMENILEATNNSHLIAGDGYTSASAVVSALQERPRHITVIDEFSKYLQAASNKYGNSHLMEANAQLMQAISRLDGTMRARSYATIGLSKDKKKELANQFVINPAITMLAMTTPDDLFNTIDVSSIKDGFLNRFIICISDAERSLRVHKEPIEVPQEIVDWEVSIRNRVGEGVENATAEPNVITVPFTMDAIKKQREFQQKCIDIANQLEAFRMDEIPGRANEMAMRLALIISLSENPNAERITDLQMQQAINWMDFNLMRLVDKLKMSVSSNEYEAHKKEILQALRDSDGGITFSAMMKRAPFSKHKRKDLVEMLTSLREADLIIDEPYQPSKGRPTTLWSAIE